MSPRKKFPLQETIVFNSESIDGTHSFNTDAFVVIVNIGGVDIRNLEVDNGSLFDILSLDTFTWIWINCKYLKPNGGTLVGTTRMSSYPWDHHPFSHP